MVSNDPILDSKVVTDELGQLGRPARPPGPRLAGRWAASREGNEGRAQEGAQRAGDDGAPPLLSPQFHAGFAKHQTAPHCIFVEHHMWSLAEMLLTLWGRGTGGGQRPRHLKDGVGPPGRELLGGK
eukprot:gene9778-biopygen1309